MKKNRIVVIAIICLIISLLLGLYPVVSETINNQLAKGTIRQYNNQVNTLSEEKKNELLKEAEEYNKSLSNVVSDSFSPDAFKISDEYNHILNVTDDGLIGSITIPKIDCSLPIYHGFSEEELKKGAIHMANTSFPIGGKSTHSVISAHTAYPGKEFFNRLTELEKDDVFNITVLDQTLYYKVTEINVVLPHDAEKLKIVNGQDLCTLVTCTPYSINSHRLLVRGSRIYPKEMTEKEKLTFTTQQNDNTLLFIITGIIGIIIIITIIVIILVHRKKCKKNKAKSKMVDNMNWMLNDLREKVKADPECIKRGNSGSGCSLIIITHKKKDGGKNEKE